MLRLDFSVCFARYGDLLGRSLGYIVGRVVNAKQYGYGSDVAELLSSGHINLGSQRFIQAILSKSLSAEIILEVE